MEVEIGIGYELATLKVTLTEFTSVVSHLSGEAKHQAVRQTLKEMIDEVRRSYDTSVDVFTPLYSIDTIKKCGKQFPNARTNFKNTYLKSTGNIRTHSGIVGMKIDDLRKSKSWMKHLPFVKKSFARLEALGTSWVANDAKLSQSMHDFLSGVNHFLDKVSQVQKKDAAEAFKYLQRSLRQFEYDLIAIKKELDELTQLSSQL